MRSQGIHVSTVMQVADGITLVPAVKRDTTTVVALNEMGDQVLALAIVDNHSGDIFHPPTDDHRRQRRELLYQTLEQFYLCPAAFEQLHG